jgi:hypothetical protein
LWVSPPTDEVVTNTKNGGEITTNTKDTNLEASNENVKAPDTSTSSKDDPLEVSAPTGTLIVHKYRCLFYKDPIHDAY